MARGRKPVLVAIAFALGALVAPDTGRRGAHEATEPVRSHEIAGPADTRKHPAAARIAVAQRASEPVRPPVAAPPARRSAPAGFASSLRGLRERPSPSGTRTRASSRVERAVGAARWADALLETGAAAPRGEAFEVAGVRHVPVQPRKEGLPVLNRYARVHERDGASIGTTGALAFPPLEAELPGQPRFALDAASAVARARAVTGVRAERGPPRAERGWFARPGATVPAWRVTLPASVPLASYQVTLHATSGETLEVANLLRHATGVGTVYGSNVLQSPAVDVDLVELDESGRLAGRIVRVFDVRGLEAFRPDRRFLFPVGDPRFVQTNVFRNLTETARLAEAWGQPPIASPLLAFVNLGVDGGGEYNNAFYDPVLQAFGFGNGDGVITANLGTDGDVAAHEMGHHLFQRLVDPELTGRNGLVDGINEGVADTFAALYQGNSLIGESTLPGEPALRDVANADTLETTNSEDPHVRGLVYGGANWSLIQQIGAEALTRILIAGLPHLAPEPELPTEYRDALRQGDATVYGGAHRAQIDAVFSARGFDPLDDFADFEELFDSAPYSGTLGNGEYAALVFSEFPGSTRIDFAMTGTGDADLLIAGFDAFDPDDPSTYRESYQVGSSEYLYVSGATLPSVHSDDFWLIGVFDYPDDGVPSSYTLTITQTLPPGSVMIDGAPYTASLDEVGEVDLLTFTGFQGDVVRLEATALSPALDPAVAIFDPRGEGTLGRNDDGGPGTDALIQGARLPYSGTFAIAVLSPLSDLDPTIGTGGYRLAMTRCTATSPDADADGLADACDDDDDQDDFEDAEDVAPFDPTRCADYDEDTCDDCTPGEWNFLADGADLEGDGECDAGDLDDDNDGCGDAVDASPLAPSVDADFDFLGEHCDNCPDVANPLQEDCNANGAGDACDTTPCPEPGAALASLVALGALFARAFRPGASRVLPARTRRPPESPRSR